LADEWFFLRSTWISSLKPEGLSQRESLLALDEHRVSGPGGRVQSASPDMRDSKAGTSVHEADAPKNRTIPMAEQSQNERTVDPLIQRLIDGSEDYNPPGPEKVIDGDFRPRVLLAGSNRTIEQFASELAKLLKEKQIFNHGGVVSVVDERTFVLRRMTPTRFRTWVECRGDIVCNTWVKVSGTNQLADASMSEETARAVLDCPTFIDGLREVVRVNTVRLPAKREENTVELLPVGYDAASKILTIETVSYDTELPAEDAVKVFEKLLKDTAFDPKDYNRSLSAATAMILAPFCDCMLSRFNQRPAFIVTANAEGAGKTMLVRMSICPVFGPAKLTPPPHVDSDKLTELLNSVAQSGAPYVVFDNWRGKIENAALEAFVTANQIGGRILGTSYTFDVEKQCLVFITGNQAIVGSDMRRRSMFINLFVREAKSEDRKVSEPIDELVILSRRSEILAACWAYVREWRDAKYPKSERRHLSFPEWGYMVGGILENMSYVCPLDSPTNDGDSMLQSFQALIVGAMTGVMTDEVYLSPSDLLDTCRNVGAFPWKIADTDPQEGKEKRAERASLAKYCELYKGRTFNIAIDDEPVSIGFDAIGQGHTREYKFTKRHNDTV
jgi:hypothetical protein